MSTANPQLRPSRRLTVVLAVAAAIVTVAVAMRVIPRRSADAGLAEQRGVGSGDHPSDESRVAGAVAAASLFTDVTKESGIEFTHECGAQGDFQLPEEMGAGGAFLDYDGDGDLDIFLVQSGVVGSPQARFHSALYRNDGGRFVDVTAESQTGVSGYGMGCACADIDNDGDVDIYVTCLGPNTLLRNNGDGTFTDATASAGVGHPGFGCGAAFLDYDRDGALDLFVANYVDWTPSMEQECFNTRGMRDYCGPLQYERPSEDVLYRNRGDGAFEDITVAAGIAGKRGNGLGVVSSDFNGDGWKDIYVANDQTPAFLWINQRDGTFREDAALLGCAFSGDGVAIAGMGVVSEDFDADGRFDLIVTNIRNQPHLALRNQGGFFEDVTVKWGLGGSSVPLTGFGIVPLDYDNDGSLELFIATGAVNLEREPLRPDKPYAERNQFLQRGPDGRFVDLAESGGGVFDSLEMSRGAAAGDYDGDGDVDLLVANNRGPAQLFRNESAALHSWVIIDALSKHGGRSAIGALVETRLDGRRMVREVRPQDSYLSSSDPRVRFGLGESKRVDRLTITWPEGDREAWLNLEANRIHRLTQGTGQFVPVVPAVGDEEPQP